MHGNKASAAIILVTISLLSGCASTTTFSSYSGKIDPLIREISDNKPVQLAQCFVDETRSRDAALYSMERGRIAQIQGDVDFSIRDFEYAMEAIRAFDEKATVSASDTLAQASAIVTNDNAIPYSGDGYERVMLHHLQAMNYLMKKDLEGAGVEVRRANEEQEAALRRHEKELEDARAEARKKQVKIEEGRKGVLSSFASMDEVAGKVKNSFQNAYTFYLSGVVYELLKQPNDAYIDYKKALEILPANAFLQKDVIRLARTLGMNDDLDELKIRFRPEGGSWSDAGDQITGNGGELLVFYEEGFVPRKQEVKVSVPVPKAGFMAVAFPIYRERWSEPTPLKIAEGAEVIGLTEPVCDTRSLAVRSLQEKIPAMVIRQIIRAAAKGVAANKSKEKFGALGELGASFYNLISENADLRSWNTLPAKVQVLRATLSPGKHRFSLHQGGVKLHSGLDLDIKEGSKTILRIMRLGTAVRVQTLVF